MPRVQRKLTDEAKLAAGGRALWDQVTTDNPDLDAPHLVQLLEVCRMKDRLDRLDEILRGDASVWMEVLDPDRPGDSPSVVMIVDKAITQATSLATAQKSLLAALKLDAAPALPERPKVPTASNVSSIERARQRAGG